MFIKTIRKSTLDYLLLLAGCVFAGWLMITWPYAVSSGISRGLAICSSIIIHSLFPFLVLAGFIVKSGLSSYIGRWLERPTRLIFGLPGCCAPGILVGFIGGYPAGGIAVGELVEQGCISRAQGRRMLGFCVNGGPAFIISAVGAGMLGSVRYGIMLYCAHIAASVLLGILLRVGSAPDGRENPPGGFSTKAPQRPSPAAAFVDSVRGACHSMLLMCGFIMLFAALLSLSDASGLGDNLQQLLSRISGGTQTAESISNLVSCMISCILEVSCGSIEAARTGAAAPILLGMALGWGGLSVHCQVCAALQGKRLISRSFFVARALHALIGGFLSALLFRFIPVAETAFKPFSDAKILPYSSNAAASASLLFLCALFLLITPNVWGKSSRTTFLKTRRKPTRKGEVNMI